MGNRLYYYLFKNDIMYYTGFIILRIFEIFLKPLPLRAKKSFGRLIGNVWHLVDFANRELVSKDMKLALGEKSFYPELRRAKRISMINTMAYLIEAYFTSKMSKEELLELVINREWQNRFSEVLRKEKGAIVLTAHFSNEALLCYLYSSFGHASCIAKYQRVFNNLMIAHRKSMNVDTLNEFDTSYERLLELVGKGEIILATIDRPLKRVKGVYVNFFGHRLLVPYYPVDIARISGAPLFVALLTSQKSQYLMHLKGPLYVPPNMEERESREKFSQTIFDFLEEHVRKYPHEWQWHNKRFMKKDWGIPRYPV